MLRALIFLSLFISAAAGAAPSADLVLLHGKLVTIEQAQPTAQALAVQGGRIVAIGSDADIQAYIGKGTQVLDLKGMTAVPGFIEGHGHLLQLGQARMELDLTHAKNWDEIVALVAAAVKKAKPGEWIRGFGWHQEKWDHPPEPNVDGYPLHASLDKVSPNNPVMLEHASEHGLYVNGVVLKLAGIQRGTLDPFGGQIVRDANGDPVGMLRDNAMNLVMQAYNDSRSQLSQADQVAIERQQVKLATADAVSKGITTFVDQGEGFATLDLLKQIAGEGGLPLRLFAQVDTSYPEPNLPGGADYAKYDAVEQLQHFLPAHRLIGYADDHFTVRAVGEILSDGALGTHTAWMLRPYDDLANNTGVSVTAPAVIRSMADVALADDYQVTVHAIGDRANHEVLDLFQAEFAAHPDAKDMRWRIEHAQHLDPADIPRFGKLGVIASMQSIHECSDAPYVVKRLGEERAKSAYAWRSLLDSGAVIANGTDTPVEDEDSIPNFYCAVTRRSKKDGVPFHPEQAMTREEALRSYTLSDAYAAFADDELGSLKVGKRADIAVLSQDIMTVPEADIPATKVMYTLVGGKVVYQRP